MPALEPTRMGARDLALDRLIAVVWLALRTLVLVAADAIAGGRSTTTRAARQRVLVIRLDNLGDFVVWVPAARVLRRKYPAERFELVLLANSAWAALASALGLFDEVWAVERVRLAHDLRYRAGWVRRIREAGFSVVVNPLYRREFVLGDLVVRAARAPESFGFDGSEKTPDRLYAGLGDSWYRTRVPSAGGRQHEIERNTAFCLGAFGMAPDYSRPWLTALSGHATALPFDGRYAIIAPGSTDPKRNWPIDRFGEIARRLREDLGLSVVLCGGPGERALVDRLQSVLSVPALDLAGRTTLVELSELVRCATIVVTNDTGGAHLAAAHGTPCVAVVGGGHFGRFLPYPASVALGSRSATSSKLMECFHCEWRCKYSVPTGEVYPCIDGVDFEPVWQSICDTLSRGAACPA